MKFANIAVVGLALLLIFSLGLTNVKNVKAQGTSTNFEGPKGMFYGVEYQDGWTSPLHWSTWETPGTSPMSSLHSFSTTFKFDSDGRDSGKANIYGEMTSIYLPADTMGSIRPWIPISWLNQMQYLQNPINNYTWEIGGKYYGMETWLCRWYVAFSAQWEGGINDVPVVGGGYGEAPPQNCYPDGDNSYYDLEVWLEINLTPTFYYVNAEKTYFAIGKIQLSNTVVYQGTTNQQGGLFSTNVVEPRQGVSVLPESESSLLYLYNEPWGGTDGTRATSYSYQGQALNPDVFRDKQYIKFDFNKFGVYGGCDWGWPLYVPTNFWCKGDVAVICFDVTVFSIGEWKVQDVQEDPENYGRFTRTDQSTDWLSWLSSPSTLAWLIPLAIIVVIVIFAPWVLFALIAVIRSITGK